jgi:peptide/nickel transport system substrate-binding protein
VSVTTDLAAGISGTALWSKTIRFADQVGGSMTVGLPSVFTQPFNPMGGSNWVFDAMVIRGVSAIQASIPTRTPVWLLQGRIERAEVVAEEGYPIAARLTG